LQAARITSEAAVNIEEIPVHRGHWFADRFGEHGELITKIVNSEAIACSQTGVQLKISFGSVNPNDVNGPRSEAVPVMFVGNAGNLFGSLGTAREGSQDLRASGQK
jgi:hypothetical protein